MGKMRVMIYNVGHGDFSLIHTPFNQNIVIDCGSGEGVVPSEILRGQKIDLFVLTHPHADHFRDFDNFKKLHIKTFLMPPLNLFDKEKFSGRHNDDEVIDSLLTSYSKFTPTNDVIIQIDNFYYKFYTASNIDYSSPNTASIVMIIKYGNNSILFGGDLQAEGWDNLLDTNKDFVDEVRNVTVFRVPHHGRVNAYSKRLLEHINPKLCIISDKSIDDSNRNTSVTTYYTNSSLGKLVREYGKYDMDKRYTLTTRKDGNIHLSFNKDDCDIVTLCPPNILL